MSDVGDRTVNEAYRRLRVDEDWCVTGERGFKWWAGPLSQEIRADPPRKTGDKEVTAVHALTTVLREVPSSSSPSRFMVEANRNSNLSATVFGSRAGVVYQHCSVYLHEDTENLLVPVFCDAAAIQVAEMHGRAKMFYDLMGGELDRHAHPSMGGREEFHEIISVVDDEFRPAGQGASPFTEADFEAAAKLDPSPAVMANHSKEGLSAEVPFSGIRTGVAAVSQGSGPSTALFRATRESHPYLGSGCLMRLILPTNVKDFSVVADLNELETSTWTGAHRFGGWHCDSEGAVSFVSFLPALCYRPGLLNEMLWSAATRATWAYEQHSQP